MVRNKRETASKRLTTAYNGQERIGFRKFALFGDLHFVAKTARITRFPADRLPTTRKKSLVFLGFFVGFRWDNDREFKDNCNYHEILKSRV